MKFTKILSVLFVVVLAACAHSSDSKLEKVLGVIKGTKTAVVEVSIGDDGMPSVKNDSVLVKVGQRIVWVGPEDMTIRFPKGSPFKNAKLPTKNSVINMLVPKQRWKEKEEEKKFKYDVIVNGKVLDPFLIIRRGF